MLQMTVRLTPFPTRSLFFSFFIFLVLSVTRSSGGEAQIERTLAIIKPDGLFGNHTDAVKKIILESGFRVLREKIVQLDQESAASFYAEHSARSFFHSLVQYMTSGPVLVMVLERDDAVSGWRTLIGPTDAIKAKITHPQSIRAMCGTDAEKNCVHGSDSSQSAQREISFFFDSMPSAEEYEPKCIIGETIVDLLNQESYSWRQLPSQREEKNWTDYELREGFSRPRLGLERLPRSSFCLVT